MKIKIWLMAKGKCLQSVHENRRAIDTYFLLQKLLKENNLTYDDIEYLQIVCTE